MKLSKQLGSVVIALAILVSSMGAFACGKDQFIAYDQIPDALGNYAKLYKCPEKDAVITKGIAQTAEWKPIFFEAEYPHRQIEALFLDGTNTGMTRYVGNNAVVNTKEVPEFWEAKVPYFVYNRIYSDFTGKFEPTNTLVTRYASAPVAKQWNYKGFENYVIEDGIVKDYSLVYAANADKVDVEYALADLKAEYEAAIEAGASYEEASKVFVGAIKNVSWLELEGPDYVTGGTMKVEPFDKIVEGNDADWYDDLLVSNIPATKDNVDLKVDYKNEYTADVEWVTVGHELKAPYRYYQVLSVNGVLMDGSEVELVGYDVIEEEKVGEVEEYETKIQLVKKGVDLVKSTTTVENDYVVTPFGTDKYTTVSVDEEYKVSQDPMRETILDTIVTPDGAEYEVRIVKEKVVPGKVKLPYIYRYQGNADPKVEWRIAFAEAAAPYEIYEEKFVENEFTGKFVATGEYRTTGKYAEDVPSLSQELSQTRVLTVMLKDTTDRTNLEWELKDMGYDYYIGGDRVNVIVPAELYPGHYDYDEIQSDVENIIYKYSRTVSE